MDILFDQGSNFITLVLDLSIILILVLYILFSVIIVRQVQLMSKVIVTGVNKYIYFFSLAHLAFALIMSLVILLTII